VSIGLVEDVLDGLVNCSENISIVMPKRKFTVWKTRNRTRVDGVGVLVGDLDAELLLDGHDDLNGVETVQAEVVGEVSSGLDLSWGVRCGLSH
jgi:hypothetical protein